MTTIITKIQNEITEYLYDSIEISTGVRFSQYNLILSIMLASNRRFRTGPLDIQGIYKFYTDIISPRIDSEVKNIDFDTSDIRIYSEKDTGAMMVFNLKLKEWMKNNGQASELNDAIEMGSGWGNVVWKKVKGGYELVNLNNFYVINQQAQTLKDTPVIERHIMTQSDLRNKKDWDNVDEVIKNCGTKEIATNPNRTGDEKETPYYEIYERNGEISEKDLFEAQGKEGGDENKYLLAKIISSGINPIKGGSTEKGSQYILYADTLTGKMSDVYKEYHRGRYEGRWFRVGMYELLSDIQKRCNQITNQISRGLEYASTTVFRSQDNLLANNILTQLRNGDVIKSTDLQQVEVRMQGLDQLLADWNRLMVQADKLSNSFEVVTGESLPSGTPFRLGGLLNQNANKFFSFIREKLGIALGDVINDWILPELIKDLKTKSIIRLTGGGKELEEYQKMVVAGWYNRNLISLPPHTQEQAELIKEKKLQELREKPEQFLKAQKDWLKDVKARAMVIITGEQINLPEKMETLSNLLQFETDPIRRAKLLDRMYAIKGIEGLPPPLPQPQQGQPQQGQKGNSSLKVAEKQAGLK